MSKLAEKLFERAASEFEFVYSSDIERKAQGNDDYAQALNDQKADVFESYRLRMREDANKLQEQFNISSKAALIAVAVAAIQNNSALYEHYKNAPEIVSE